MDTNNYRGWATARRIIVRWRERATSSRHRVMTGDWTSHMPKTSASTPQDTFVILQDWIKAAKAAVLHIGATRGSHAPYYCIKQQPWPIEAIDTLKRDTSFIIEYLDSRHALHIGVPLKRIVLATDNWLSKRNAVEAFGKTKHTHSEAAAVAARELERFTDDGLPEQRRINLDLRVAEGALWRAAFPLLAQRGGNEDRFLIRRNLIHWALWIQKAFAQVIREWALPDERVIPSMPEEDGEASAVWLESMERWELAATVLPRYIPDTDETPKKLAIDEARRIGDLIVALPLIKRLDEEIDAFVVEAVYWPQGNRQPARTEHLLRAVDELQDLVSSKSGTSGGKQKTTPPAWERLQIVKSNTGDDLACLDGIEYRLTGANDATLLEQLQMKHGEPILGATLEAQCNERPARIYGRLPKPLQSIIDKPGQRTGRKGYRML